jgi:hypothetical protein
MNERSHRVDDQEFYQLLDKDGITDDIHLFNEKLREWGPEPATSWFVAAMTTSQTRDSIDEFELCHAQPPRDEMH